MIQRTFLHVFFSLSFVLLTACGGSGNDTEVSTTKDVAIEKIMAFAEDQNKEAPTVQDYIDAGLTGINSENLVDINALVATVSAEDVDTTEELLALKQQLGINSIPSVSAGEDKTVEVNQSITITGTASDIDGTIASYEWKKGASLLATTASFDYTPTVVGVDTLTLSVTDDDGDSASDSMIVKVTPLIDKTPPTITINFTKGV